LKHFKFWPELKDPATLKKILMELVWQLLLRPGIPLGRNKPQLRLLHLELAGYMGITTARATNDMPTFSKDLNYNVFEMEEVVISLGVRRFRLDIHCRGNSCLPGGGGSEAAGIGDEREVC
jgi:hypothetical protein